ncbi:hypothetical protein LSTR_LSTR017374 [Laodelphax striatellus]|uniref:Uncharacterized protein n=1 Tax=Laodelphax striatellus TaxID=195883 RepID=A0A482WI06_LAOST|nr:hypothetical protein LSTR_LSTR017374 [Laodelphax striatellus]
MNEEHRPTRIPDEENSSVNEEHNYSKSENNQTLPPQQSYGENHNKSSDWEIAEASTTRINLRKVKKMNTQLQLILVTLTYLKNFCLQDPVMNINLQVPLVKTQVVKTQVAKTQVGLLIHL